jgi:hypothetical protein
VKAQSMRPGGTKLPDAQLGQLSQPRKQQAEVRSSAPLDGEERVCGLKVLER